MKTDIGIQSKAAIGNAASLDHSILVKLDENNTEQLAYIKAMDAIYDGCGYILQQYKGQVKLPHFNPNMALATGFKSIIYRPVDEMSGQPVQGRAPSMFFKLFSRGKAPYVEQTVFTGLDNKPIPWTLLQNVEMKFIPLIHIKRIFIGSGKASVQMDMVSAIVTEIRARFSSGRQLHTLNNLNQARPELADIVSGQLAKITSDRQDQLIGSAVPPAQKSPTHSTNADQPTFAGISGQKSNAQHTIGTLPTIPILGGGAQPPSIQDFIASPPTRLPTIPTGNTLQFS